MERAKRVSCLVHVIIRRSIKNHLELTGDSFRKSSTSFISSSPSSAHLSEVRDEECVQGCCEHARICIMSGGAGVQKFLLL